MICAVHRGSALADLDCAQCSLPMFDEFLNQPCYFFEISEWVLDLY